MTKRQSTGGSLVELLTALAVGGLVLGLFLQVLLGAFGLVRDGSHPSRWRFALFALASIRHDVESARVILSPRRRGGAARGPVLVLAAWDGAIVAYHLTKRGLWRSSLGGDGTARSRLFPATADLDGTFQYRGKTIRAVRIRLRVGTRLLMASAVPSNSACSPAPPAGPHDEAIPSGQGARPVPGRTKARPDDSNSQSRDHGLTSWLTSMERLCLTDKAEVKP